MTENMTLGRALEIAIETERIGNEVYRKLAARHEKGSELHGLFERLAEDEKLHESRLRELGGQLDEAAGRELSDQDSEYLRSVSWREIFHGDPDPIAAADRVTSRKDALEMASRLERSTLVYYSGVRDLLGDHPVLEEIMAMEKRHLTQIIKYLMDPEAKVRGTEDRWT